MEPFTITEETIHHAGDRACQECVEDYPEACVCGGVMHAENAEAPDADGNYPIVTRCDYCGRSEDELDRV